MGSTLRHIFLDNIKSTNELYQIMRRMRGELRSVPIVIHLSEKARQELNLPPEIKLTDGGAWGQLLKVAAKKNTQEANARTITWLNEKIKAKALRVIKHGLLKNWEIYLSGLVQNKSYAQSMKTHFTKENYKQAVQKVLENHTILLDKDLDKQYVAIQERVNARFLEIVNDYIVKVSLTRDMTDITNTTVDRL